MGLTEIIDLVKGVFQDTLVRAVIGILLVGVIIERCTQ